MDVVFKYREEEYTASGTGNYLIMDNDSGYISNNLDQESNSDSITETMNNSSVEILKSFLPKSIYISEDALLERPDLDQTISAPNQEECTQDFHSLPYDGYDNGVTSIKSADECVALPNFNSFQSDSGSSTPSVVVPVAEPIYYNLSNKINSSPHALTDYENISSNPSDGPFFGYENVPMEGSNRVHKNGLDIFTNEAISTEVKVNSLLFGLFGYNQKTSVAIETARTSDEESKIPHNKEEATIIKEPVTVENSFSSFTSIKESDCNVNKNSGAIPEDFIINIEELPVVFENGPTFIEIPNEKSITISATEQTAPELTPQKSQSNEEATSTVENSHATNDTKQNITNTCDKNIMIKMDASPLENIKCHLESRNKVHSEAENSVLTNLTNTGICSNNEASTSKVGILPRRNSVKNKENTTESELFKTPSKCRKRKYSEIGSPDLFSDDESTRAGHPVTPKVIEERFVHKLDHKLIKRVQRTISGVPPPPELTITNLTVDDMLEKLKANQNLFWTEENLRELKNESAEKEKTSPNGSLNSTFGCSSSILIEGQQEDAIAKTFPEILYSRHHGLHYNRSKLSEEIEYICDKYAKRYIGAETQSTCCAVETQYMSPNKRRTAKPKWAVKSPGRRLSHLAKRRITFSSASLQASSSSSAASRARQILIDYKKLELLNKKKSPKKSPRKTPLKSPLRSPSNGRTPSSSAKQKLRMRFRLLSGNFNELTSEPSSSISNSKRALFQSPDKDSQFRKNLSTSSSSIGSAFERDLASRGTKRSLFSSPNKVGCRISLFMSPSKKSPFKNQQTFEKKRKRDDDDENIHNQPKLFRSQSSYGVSEKEPKSENSLSRTKSESVLMQSHAMSELSAANKKKLQWAVYESLKLQNISTTHPQFKVFASVLARVTRRCIVSSNIRLESSGTSEKMLRIARRHSYAVVKGKSVEEIMNEFNKSKTRNLKPQGYIAPQDYNPMSTKESSANREFVLKDRDSNSGDSVTKNLCSQSTVAKPESRIDRIRKVINFEDNR